MKDIAIVIDSSRGLNKYQAEKFGYYFLPLQIEINEKNTMMELILITKISLIFLIFSQNQLKHLQLH
ncbi:DegV family protein [Mycoplasmopsis cynos]|nr:DegV family protein [Mycoplasmopsis cynos]